MSIFNTDFFDEISLGKTNFFLTGCYANKWEFESRWKQPSKP